MTMAVLLAAVSGVRGWGWSCRHVCARSRGSLERCRSGMAAVAEVIASAFANERRGGVRSQAVPSMARRRRRRRLAPDRWASSQVSWPTPSVGRRDLRLRTVGGLSRASPCAPSSNERLNGVSAMRLGQRRRRSPCAASLRTTASRQAGRHSSGWGSMRNVRRSGSLSLPMRAVACTVWKPSAAAETIVLDEQRTSVVSSARATLIIARLIVCLERQNDLPVMESGLDFVTADLPLQQIPRPHVLAAIAEYESQLQSERTKSAYRSP